MSALVRQTQDNPAGAAAREQMLLQVRRLYVGFTQGLFHAAPRGSYHWEPELKATEIVVTDENPIHLDAIGKRPAVSFTRSPVQFFGLGLDDMLSYNASTGEKKKSILIAGTMSINCCSRNDLESEFLAGVLAEQFWMHRELLMRAGFFDIGRNFGISSPSPAGSLVQGDSADEWYATTVTSPFYINRTSKFTPLNEGVVQNILFNLKTRTVTNDTSTWGPAIQGEWLQQYPEEQGEGLPKMPHPLDPTKQVTVRSVHPNRPGIRPPTIRGRTIPVKQPAVEGSALLTFKV